MADKKPQVPVAFTRKSLAEKVCLLVYQDGMKYSEALLEVCEEFDIDPHDIAKISERAIEGQVGSRSNEI